MVGVTPREDKEDQNARSAMHIDHTRRHSIMIRTVALIALVGSASAAAADYSSAEIGCTNSYNYVTCDYTVTETACINAHCLWKDDDGDLYCGLSADEDEVFMTDDLAAEEALKSNYDTCYSKGSSANCDDNCSWNEDNGSCDVTVTKVESVLDADGANGGTTAGFMTHAFIDINCAHRATTGIACEAVDGCALQTIGAKTRCYISQVKYIKTVETKCGTNGAAARSTAQAAAGISSGANAAAPAMIIISALVGALAIFA